MRLTVRRLTALGLGALGVPAVACVIADPPASVPPTPVVAPQIEHALVSPPTTTILRSWPPSFAIPVLVLDSTATVAWEAFIDYSPQNNGFVAGDTISPGQTLDDAGDRLLEITIPPSSDLNACHTIEVVVAYAFDSNHVPNSLGGDSVSWFYSPSGSLDGCPIFEAGAAEASTTEDAGAVIPEDTGAGG